jgi:hypothetical protein
MPAPGRKISAECRRGENLSDQPRLEDLEHSALSGQEGCVTRCSEIGSQVGIEAVQEIVSLPRRGSDQAHTTS